MGNPVEIEYNNVRINPMPASGGSVALASSTSTLQKTTITSGGTAQNLFSGATPTNATICTAVNALRTALVNLGLAA